MKTKVLRKIRKLFEIRYYNKANKAKGEYLYWVVSKQNKLSSAANDVLSAIRINESCPIWLMNAIRKHQTHINRNKLVKKDNYIIL